MIVVPTAADRVRGNATPFAAEERSRLRAAAHHARRALPGPLGELVHRELIAYADFGYRMAADALIPRLAADVLARPVAD